MSERHTGFYASPKYLEFTSRKIWLCEAEYVGKGDFVATSSAGKWEKKKVQELANETGPGWETGDGRITAIMIPLCLCS